MSRPDALARSPLVKRRPPYPWAWAVSLALHGGILLALVLVSIVAERSEPPLLQKPMLVRLGTPRPDHLLPRKPTAPPVPPAAREAPVATPGEKRAPESPSPTPSPTPPKSEAKQPAVATPASSSQPPAQQAAAPRDAKQDSKAKLDEIMRRFAAGAIAGPLEDLPGSPDGHPDGDADRAEGEAYYALLERRIKDQYQLPATLSERDRLHLRAKARIFIEANGRISRFESCRGRATPSSTPPSKRRSTGPPPSPRRRSVW